MLGGVGVEAYASVAEACESAVRVTGKNDPSPAATIYADYYPRYRALYPALAAEFAAMARVGNKHLKP